MYRLATQLLLPICAASVALTGIVAGASVKAADEQYYLVPLGELHLTEGTLPSADGSVWNRWQQARAGTLRPAVSLDAAGDVYLQLPADWRNGPDYLRSAWLAVRVAELKTPTAITGRLSLPANDLNGMRHARFSLPSGAARSDAETRRRFYEALEGHYRLLLADGLPGGAWFRHRLRQARVARGEPADPPWDALRVASLDDTFALLAPERGLSERLHLGIAGLPEGSDHRAVPIDSLRALSPQAFPKAEAAKDAPPAIDPLAPRVPGNQYAIFFPSFEEMVRAMDEWDSLGAELMAYALGNAGDRQFGPWYRRQMCIEVTALDRLLGPKLVASAALTGADLYFTVGTDAAMLFEAKNVEALQTYFLAKQQAARLAVPGTLDVSGTEAGVEYIGVRSPDRRICSYLFTIGNVVGVTNSLVQLRRLVETSHQKTANLADSAEYRFFRGRHARAKETAFLAVSEAALRHWLSPRSRVLSSRRTRAAALLSELQAEQLDELVAGRIEPGGRAIAGQVPGLGKLNLDPRGVRSSVYGTLEFMTPIVEQEVDGVTQAEADAYYRWRGGFDERWLGFMAPLAISATAKPERISFAASVAPMPSHDWLQTMARLAGKATLRTPPGGQTADERTRALFSAALAFDAESELWRNLGQFLDLYLGIAGAHRSVGPSISVHGDNDPAWARLAAAADPQAFWRGAEGLPLAAQADAANWEMSRRILASFHRQGQSLFGRPFTWEARRHQALDYFRVQGGFLAGEAPLVYQAAGPTGLVISPDEASLRRALARQLAKSGRSASDESSAALGRHLTFGAQRTALDVAERLLSTDVERTAAARSWSSLPVLDEWKRRYPKQDPVALHERFWHVALKCPGGGKYTAIREGEPVGSAVFGRPEAARETNRRPGPLHVIHALRFGATFEQSGLAVRAEIGRNVEKGAAKKDGPVARP